MAPLIQIVKEVLGSVGKDKRTEDKIVGIGAVETRQKTGGAGLNGHVQMQELPGPDHRQRHHSLDCRLTEQVSEGNLKTVFQMDPALVINIRVAHPGDDVPFAKRAAGGNWSSLLDHDTMN